MGNEIYTYSRPSQSEFDDQKIVFYTYKGSRYEENYRKLNQFFQTHYQIEDENYSRCCPIMITGVKGTYTAAVAILEEGWLSTTKNSDFQKYSEYALQQRLKLSENDVIPKIDALFLAKIAERNQLLLLQNNKLRNLAAKLLINLDDYPQFSTIEDEDALKQMQHTVENNQNLMLQNQTFHQLLIEKAREKTVEYNDMACRATIANAAMTAIKNSSLLELDSLSRAILIAECQASYPDYQDKNDQEQLEIQKRVGLRLKTPKVSDKIYAFKNPEELFPFAEGQGHITFSDDHYHLGNNLKKLEENINNLFLEASSAEVEVSTFIEFWKGVKRFFHSIWQSLIRAFNTGISDKLQNGMQIDENIENVVEQRPLSENARLIHRFNSQQSPLISIMYDKSLSDTKKLEIFNILVNAEKYNQKQKNIDLPAKDDKSSYSFEGPPLLHAVKLANKEMIISLLKNGADANGRGYYIGIKNIGYKGITALHMAVAENNFEAVKLLIEYGADINAQNDDKQTPLHAASSKEITEYLISKGANVNSQDKHGNSPLHWAAKHNHLPVLQSLLSAKGIIVDKQNNDGNTPLSMAAYYGISSIEHSYSFYQSCRNQTNSMLSEDNLHCLTRLIKAGANINHQNAQGYSPLLFTILMGEDCMGDNSRTQNPDYDFLRKKVELLCENGADTNKASFAQHKQKPSITPLQALYRHDISDKKRPDQKKSVAEVLIEYNANPKVLGINGETLLHQCARNGDAQALAYFIEQCQLDPNLINVDGVSPLEELCHWNLSSYSYKSRGEACIKVLSNRGADPTIKRSHTLKINRQTLNPHLPGIYLQDKTIEMIFEDKNNVFSQKAMSPLPTNATERRQLLTQIYNELGQESLTVEIPLYPEQLGFFNGEYNSTLYPSTEAIKQIETWRQEYIAQQRNTFAI